MVERTAELNVLRRYLKSHPVVAILGARQVGKTTLAAQLAREHRGPVVRFDLEDPRDLARLEDPMLALEPLRGLVVLDEIQRLPDLFPVLRVLVDRRPRRARFLILGSASPDLLRQSSESLAGRIIYSELSGFHLDEAGPDQLDRLWRRGGFPEAYLARSERESFEWRRGFIRTFLERDIPSLGTRVPASTLRRFWTMLAHYHGQTWNSSEFASSFGVADTTVRRYLDLLVDTFVVRQLQPFVANIRKRQVKSPKVYLADSGLLHTLLGLETKRDLDGHPKVGASWEGFMLDNVTRQLGARAEECFFWATHSGAELDLVVCRGAKRIGFEFKRTTAPKLSKSMHLAREDLKLKELVVIHAGTETFPLSPWARAVAASRLVDDVRAMR